MRIGLLGGSFNPAHAGHRHISLLAQARLRLDFFGADLGVMDDGRFVLFEANAAMTIAEPVVLRADLVRRMRPVIQEVEAGLRRHLAKPSGWRMAHRQS